MSEIIFAKLNDKGVKIVRVIDSKVIVARCEAAKEAKYALPMTYKPFVNKLARIVPVKKLVKR